MHASLHFRYKKPLCHFYCSSTRVILMNIYQLMLFVLHTPKYKYWNGKVISGLFDRWTYTHYITESPLHTTQTINFIPNCFSFYLHKTYKQNWSEIAIFNVAFIANALTIESFVCFSKTLVINRGLCMSLISKRFFFFIS